MGVTMRRTNGSHAAMANWNSDDTTMRLASVARSASVRATTEIAMKWGPAPVIRMWPAPTRPTCAACSAVVTPAMTSAAKTAQPRYSSPSPAARTMMVTIRTVLARMSTTP